MVYSISIIVRIIIAAILAVILGNGSVVAFNHFPMKWFESIEEDAAGNEVRRLPDKLLEADNAGKQRLPSSPWKYTFVGYFGIVGIYFSITGLLQFEIAAMLLLAIVLEMAISDQLYKIVPDQLQLMLALTAIGFASYNEEWWEPVLGAAIGLVIGASIYALGRLIYHTDSIGGADMKFFIVIGLVLGRAGVLCIFVLTTILFALEGVFLIVSKKGSMKDMNAMMPAALLATTIYLLFLWNSGGIIKLF